MNTHKEGAFSFGGVFYEDSSELKEGPGFSGSAAEMEHAKQLAAARQRFKDQQAKPVQPKPVQPKPISK